MFVLDKIDDLGLDPYAFRIYGAMCRRAGKPSGVFWESIVNVAERTGMSAARARQAVRLLERLGLVTGKRRTGQTTEYAVTATSALPSSLTARAVPAEPTTPTIGVGVSGEAGTNCKTSFEMSRIDAQAPIRQQVSGYHDTSNRSTPTLGVDEVTPVEVSPQEVTPKPSIPLLEHIGGGCRGEPRTGEPIAAPHAAIAADVAGVPKGRSRIPKAKPGSGDAAASIDTTTSPNGHADHEPPSRFSRPLPTEILAWVAENDGAARVARLIRDHTAPTRIATEDNT